MEIVPSLTIAEAMNLPLDLAVRLIDARGRRIARIRCAGARPAAAQPQRVARDLPDGRRVVTLRGDAAFEFFRNPPAIGRPVGPEFGGSQ